MNYGFKGKHKGSSSGRPVLISIIVITSTLSFTLGYFVGKAALKEKQQPSISEPQQVTSVQPLQGSPPAQQEQPVQNNEPTVLNTTQIKPKEDRTEPDKNTTVQPASAKKESPEPAPKESIPLQIAAEKKEGAKTIMYTVQAGAFKNLKDAEALKHKLEKKGYKTYIKKSASKDTKLFKVRTGEFSDKEKADAVASKLKKEGLKAFATPKSDEGNEMPSHAKQEKPR